MPTYQELLTELRQNFYLAKKQKDHLRAKYITQAIYQLTLCHKN